MIATTNVDETTRGTSAEDQPSVHPDTLAVGRCECFVCESVIPPLCIKVTPTGESSAGGSPRSRRVDLLCQHCDSAFELHQVRRDGEWRTMSASTANAFGRERIARSVANQTGATYVDRPADESTDADDEAARLSMIAELDLAIARHEQLAAQGRRRRADLMGVSPAESAALGVNGPANQFPFVGGDARHLMGDGFDEPFAHG